MAGDRCQTRAVLVGCGDLGEKGGDGSLQCGCILRLTLAPSPLQAIVVAIIVFVGPTENWSIGLLLGMIAVIAALVVQVHARPYEVPAANRLEETSLLATFLTWAVGLHFYNDEPLNEPWKLSLATLLILAINVLYVQRTILWCGLYEARG